MRNSCKNVKSDTRIYFGKWTTVPTHRSSGSTRGVSAVVRVFGKTGFLVGSDTGHNPEVILLLFCSIICLYRTVMLCQNKPQQTWSGVHQTALRALEKSVCLALLSPKCPVSCSWVFWETCVGKTLQHSEINLSVTFYINAEIRFTFNWPDSYKQLGWATLFPVEMSKDSPPLFKERIEFSVFHR